MPEGMYVGVSCKKAMMRVAVKGHDTGLQNHKDYYAGN